MNWLTHPAVVHLPLGLACIAPLLLAALWLGSARGWPRSTWLLAIGVQAVLAGGALLALSTGEAAEERAEARVAEATIGQHKRMAQTFTVSSFVVLAALLLAWRLPAGRVANGARVFALAGSLATLGLGIATGHAGGAIAHSDAIGATTPTRTFDDDR